MKDIIDVQDLVKKYKKAGENAVNDISLKVREGEFFAFLGPNGAGKTTTISILTTNLSKTSGKVTIAGYDLDRNPSEVRRNIGVIFQNPSLDANLTAEENIRFHAVLYNLFPFRPTYSMMPPAYKKRVQELTRIMGIDDQIFKPIKTFSGGMKRKLEIIRSLMHNPKILFLDEPTSGLDPLSRRDLWNYLEDVRDKEGVTVFLTTHYLEEAEDADNIAVINKGNIIVYGTPSEIKKKLTREYLLMSSTQKEKLKNELIRKHISFEGDELIKIYTSPGDIQKLIKNIDTPLNYLRVHNPTLEDAYLKIIQENENI